MNNLIFSQGIATLFVLCDVRTVTLYDALWNKITQLAPQLEQNIKFIMSDFEIAAVKSLNKKFPSANLTGCWFHFNQVYIKVHLFISIRTISVSCISRCYIQFRIILCKDLHCSVFVSTSPISLIFSELNVSILISIDTLPCNIQVFESQTDKSVHDIKNIVLISLP